VDLLLGCKMTPRVKISDRRRRKEKGKKKKKKKKKKGFEN